MKIVSQLHHYFIPIFCLTFSLNTIHCGRIPTNLAKSGAKVEEYEENASNLSSDEAESVYLSSSEEAPSDSSLRVSENLEIPMQFIESEEDVYDDVYDYDDDEDDDSCPEGEMLYFRSQRCVPEKCASGTRREPEKGHCLPIPDYSSQPQHQGSGFIYTHGRPRNGLVRKVSRSKSRIRHIKYNTYRPKVYTNWYKEENPDETRPVFV